MEHPGADLILIVEDERDLAASYERLLRRRGHDVIIAGSCQGGLDVLQRHPLALLVSDVRLPDGDGLTVVRAARNRQPPVPAIVITGQPSDQGRLKALAAGAAAYFSKPMPMATLLAVVDEALASGKGAPTSGC